MRAIAAGIGLAALVLASGEGAARDLDAARIRRVAESGKETVIGIGARWDKACRGLAAPEVWLDQAPARGFVCIRAAMVKPRNLLFGNAGQCLTRDIAGVQIVYRSQTGFAGDDTLGYILKFPRGAKPVIVDVQVTPATGARRERDAPFERQTSGRMPDCAALMS